ncbi:MAG: glycine cleavage system aminomethyltransferase GcvT [Verrucomicrobiota bacterium]
MSGDSPENQRSPLHALNADLGARFVPFAGWEMPVMFDGIIPEHEAVRTGVGVFDISHMGEFFVDGAEAESWLDGLLTNNVAKLSVGAAHYTLLLNDDGGVIDDLILYRIGKAEFLLIVNAAKIDEDREWMEARLNGSVNFKDHSSDHAALAVQGPKMEDVFDEVFDEAIAVPERNSVIRVTSPSGMAYVCGTGYTGEDGFELIIPANDGAHWYQKILDAGAKPCGLGARDSLRLEMAYPLNGSDLAPNRTPLEAGLGWAVDLGKEAFVGRNVLAQQKANGIPTKLSGIELPEKGPPPRANYGVFHGGEQVAELTSGGLSPTLGKRIGLAYLPKALSKIDTELEIDIRGKRFAARVVKKPFYNPATPSP